MADIWYLYVVRCSDDTLYTGITTDPKRRLEEHNTSDRGAQYTSSRRQMKEMVLLGNFTEKGAALRAEARFKKLTRREKIMYVNEGGF